jgi:DNA mismatch endonuclease (patch repair protein)
MRRNPRRDTKPEIALRSELHRLGLRFRKDLPIRTAERVVRPDVVFTRARLAVFVDGCFWHSCPLHGNVPRANTAYWVPKLERNVHRDREVDAVLATAGWIVLRAWEHEDVTEVAASVYETLMRLRDQAARANTGESTTTPAARNASRTPSATC